MSAQAVDAALVNDIKKRWKDLGVRDAVIIDDAYDRPSRAILPPDDIAEFVAHVAADEAAGDDLRTRYEREISQPDDLDDDLIGRLFDDAGALGAARAACDTLFADHAMRLADLKPLEDSLQQHLGVTVTRVGSDGPLPGTVPALVFVDYQLGLDAGGPDRAVERVQALLTEGNGGASRPVIVLISAQQPTEDQVNDLRSRTGLIPGVFQFVRKQELTQRAVLLCKLDRYLACAEPAWAVQRFLEEADSAVERTTEEFRRQVRHLPLSDYAYLQNLALQDDGHPLGDYLLWLFQSLMTSLVARDDKLAARRAALNRHTFAALPADVLTPSAGLAGVYGRALAWPADEDLCHPRDACDGSDGMPLLHTGDMFLKDVASEVWLVVTAQCDLSFAPGAPGRKPKGDRSVFLMPGKLVPLIMPVTEYDRSKPRTELFELDGHPLRIVWNTKHVVARKLQEITSWAREGGYRRAARLQLPHALRLQQAFGTDLTRIGLPVPPPLYLPALVSLLCSDEAGKAVVVASRMCPLHVTERAMTCRLDDDMLLGLPIVVNTALDNVAKRKAALQAVGDSVTQTDKWQATLKPYRAVGRVLADLGDPVQLPFPDTRLGKTHLKLFHYCRNGNHVGQSYCAEQPFILQVCDCAEGAADG